MSRASLLLVAGAVLIGGAPHGAGDSICRPALAVRAVDFSPIERGQRTWTARIAVDASRCAAASGRFSIRFVRLKETAPDLAFSERFTWVPGEVKASTLFAADEAVLSYAIEAAPCPCRY